MENTTPLLFKSAIAVIEERLNPARIPTRKMNEA
jgi:hypothetical protein